MQISQNSSNGAWGGSQGNDTAVNITITFSDGRSPITFPGAINWVKNAGGGGFDWVGITTNANVSDGYTLSSGASRTYILQFAHSSLDLAALLPNDLDGSANTGQALNALNQYFPGSALAFTGTNSTSGSSPSYSFNYAENRAAGATLGSVAATGGSGTRSYSITGGNTNGWFAIDSSTGAITLTSAGAASLANDFEQTPNAQALTVRVSDGTSNTSINVALNETDVADAPLAFTGTNATSGGNPSYSFDYAENRATGATLGSVAATGGSGTRSYSITGGNTNGWFAIDSSTGAITLTSAGAASLANDFEQTPNAQALTVRVSDGTSNTSINVALNETDVADAPLAFTGTNATSGGSPSYSFDYAENRATGATLGSVAATGGSGTRSYSITGGNTNGWFAIDSSTGTITLTSAGAASLANDFEQTPNAQALTVQVSDGTGNAVIQVALRESDIDDTAPIVSGPGTGGSKLAVNEGQTSVAKLDAGEPVTWSIVGGPDASRFAIAPDGTITFTAAPDYEQPGDRGTDNEYEIIVEARDAAGNATTQAINVTVLDLDDTAPVISGPGIGGTKLTVSEGQTSVAKLGAGEPVTWSIVGGPDQSKFRIAPDGTITFNAAPDYEAPADGGTNNEFEIIVEAQDANGNVSTQAIIVTVLDVDDTAPVISGPGTGGSKLAVNEGQTSVAKLGAGEPVTWSIVGGPDASRFAIAPDGTITFKAAPDYEQPGDRGTDNDYEIIVEARDAAGNATTQAVIVTVLDLDDTPPLISGPGTGGSKLSVNEGQTSVAKLGAGEPVTWSIVGGPDAAKFAIAPDGTITFEAAPDYERPSDGGTNNEYEIIVEARDAAGNVSTQAIIVTVLDLDDTAPVITGPGTGGSKLTVNEGQTSVARLGAGEPVTWAVVGGPDASKFTIATDGTITFTAAPDYETPSDGGTNNEYEIIVEARDAAGNVTTQAIIVTVLNLDDTAPVISGPGTGGSKLTVNEGQTSVAKLGAGEPVTWAVISGPDASKFAIAPDGTITFTAAPDYEQPGDRGTDNEYEIIVEARDAAGNATTQAIIVTVLDLDDTAPVITGPGTGGSTLTVNEGQISVAKLGAGEPVSWAIVGGPDAWKFAIAPDGTITFTAAPDYEKPGDRGTDNEYEIIVEARDSAGNATTQAIIVSVVDLDDTAPVISGAGSAGSTLTVNEGQTSVAKLGAGEPVTWSISGGPDAAKFAIAADGSITFNAAPDYESPEDANRDNSYVLEVRAVDAAGNEARQEIIVTVVNLDEIGARFAAVRERLRDSLRNYAFGSLQTMLAFNEGLAKQGPGDDCTGPAARQPLSGSVNASDANQQLAFGYRKRLNGCDARVRLYGDMGVSASRAGDDWTVRTLGSVRAETSLGGGVVVGAGILGSHASEKLGAFQKSQIADKSLQINLYGRARLSDKLRAGAFLGLGTSWYDFDFTEDGFAASGEMKGSRHVYGGSLAGDIRVGRTVVTTEAVLSRARETLRDPIMGAHYAGESRSKLRFPVGAVDGTRLSVPLHVPFVLLNDETVRRRKVLLEFDPGLLCEDTAVGSSKLTCGYGLGAKLNYADVRGRGYVDVSRESVAGRERYLLSAGYSRSFGSHRHLEVGASVGQAVSGKQGDYRALVQLKALRF